jgi:hypothetical protein
MSRRGFCQKLLRIAPLTEGIDAGKDDGVPGILQGAVKAIEVRGCRMGIVLENELRKVSAAVNFVQ